MAAGRADAPRAERLPALCWAHSIRPKAPIQDAQPQDHLPMEALNLPRPAWMTEDLVMLEEQARRFIASEFTPHLDRWHEAGAYERDVWTKAGSAGLLCATIPEEYLSLI